MLNKIHISRAIDCARPHSRVRKMGPAVASLLFVVACAPLLQPKDPQWTYTSKEFLQPIKYLASDNLKGRGDGTPELEKAARYIERRFKKYGLQPGGDNGSYLQRFTITAGAKLGPNNSLISNINGTTRMLKVGDDFLPFSFSDSLAVNAPLVFVGYGITAPESHYDDYHGIDAKGKIVLILRHE